MSKSKGLYATEIPAKVKRTAYSNPVGKVEMGFTPPTVPERAGQLHGLGPTSHAFGHPSVRGAHGFGHVAKLKHGHLRLSGLESAHRLGASVPKGKKTP
jgi:hypothetical protein